VLPLHHSHHLNPFQFHGAEVVKRTAELAAQWQCVGWCHGVLNTDNMRYRVSHACDSTPQLIASVVRFLLVGLCVSIVGVTIDYGPFGFMDFYNPNYICNASDNEGRYAYKNQPQICKWNCQKLAEALSMVCVLHLCLLFRPFFSLCC